MFLLRPGVAGVPSKLDDVPVAVEVTGMFVAGALTAPLRPAPNGYSIGHPAITAGTLGAVVQDAGGVCHVLSNNHVLANVNKAAIGDNTLQPGSFDGGQNPDDAIATLADFQVIAFDGSPNTIDAAIAEVMTPVNDFVSATGPYFTPTSTLNTDVNLIELNVKKTGRTTELTTGEVIAFNATTSICYECSGPFCFRCKKAATFVGQIVTTDMSEGGDSGSLTVDTGNHPVGLLFAGSSTRTIHNPIGPVLARFNATVISDLGSCTNGGTPVDNPPSVTVTNPTSGSTVSGTVTVTADASDDGSVTQVKIFVDGSPIGIDTDDPWSTSWDTGTLGDGSSHTVSAEATDNIGQTTASANVTVTVDNSVPPPPSSGVTVSSILPPTTQAGTTIPVTIIGSGFVLGASVSFENGSGPAPTANVVSVDANTIMATVTVKGGGPRGDRVWDVRVTNLDNSSGALVRGFTVTR